MLGVLALAAATGAGFYTRHRVDGAAVAGAANVHNALPATDVPSVPLSFDVFAHPHNKLLTARRLGEHETVQADDSYTFVLYNHTGGPTRFMLFAMDMHSTFFWFYPDVNASKQNINIPLPASPITTLPEAVTPRLSGGNPMQFFGLFMPKVITEAQVEEIFAHGGVDALRAELDAQVQALAVDVAPLPAAAP